MVAVVEATGEDQAEAGTAEAVATVAEEVVTVGACHSPARWSGRECITRHYSSLSCLTCTVPSSAEA